MKNIYTPFQPTLTQPGLHRFELNLQIKQPLSIFNGVIHTLLQIETKKPTPYPVMPDGTQAVYISPQGTMIGGAQTEAIDIPLLQAGEYFGIWFFPGALRYFFNINLSEISNQFVDEKFFECNRFTQLHDEIYKHNTFNERANICEKWLLNQYSRQPQTSFDKALSVIYQNKGNERISQLANKVGWSSRHLNRQFLQHTGLNTKAFCQIIRSQHVCKQLFFSLTNKQDSSFELGYYDQSHLIKAFNKYFGSPPGIFFNRFMSDFYNR